MFDLQPSPENYDPGDCEEEKTWQLAAVVGTQKEDQYYWPEEVVLFLDRK